MNKKIKTSAVLCGLILAACQQPASPDPNPQPQPETRSFTLTISAEGVQPVSALRTLTVGSDNSASIVWKPEYQNRNISISVSGDGKSAPGANVSIAVVPDAPSTKISTDDDARLKAQLDVVVLQLAAMGITAAYSYSAMPSPVPSYANPNAQTRNITIALSRDGVPLPEISATLVEGESASGTFQWLPAYQKAATNFLMSVDGDTNPLPASAAAFTLNINGSPVGTKMSDADWSKLEAAVNAGLATIADMNVAIGKNLDETTVSRVADYPPPSTETVVEDVPALGTGGPAAKLSIPANGSQATLEIGTAGANYSDPTALGVLGFSSDLTGKSVAISFASQNPANVSLAYVHYVREALRAAGGTAASVSAPADKFTPVFNSHEWLTINAEGNGAAKNLYTQYSSASSYSSGGIEIMNDIKIFKDASNKYMIAYNRPIQASDITLGTNNEYGMTSYPFLGFGLKKETSGSISPVGNNPILIHGGKDDYSDTYYNAITDFTTYKSLLEEAGLYPSSTMLPDHNKVKISGPGTGGPNVAANGMYDFILAYYNPKSDGTFAGADLSARLPLLWPASGFAFDGAALPAGITSRNVGGSAADSMSRKGDKNTSGTPAAHVAQPGEPRTDFVGNITVLMANYMKDTVHVSEFRNTNIIGDGDKWSAIHALPDLMNVGLVGDYSSLAVNTNGTSKIRGVLDITGTAPLRIENDSKAGYVNLWSITSDIGLQKFEVISIKNLNGINYVNKVNAWGTPVPTNVIIYPKKYAVADISSEITGFKPQYRAFLDGSDAQTGTPAIIPADATFTNVAHYKGTVISTGGAPSVAPLDEDSWINAANSNNGAAPAFVDYTSAPKLNGTSFGNIVASAAPQSLGTRLAGAARQVIDAVLPGKPAKKSRFEEAYLAQG